MRLATAASSKSLVARYGQGKGRTERAYIRWLLRPSDENNGNVIHMQMIFTCSNTPIHDVAACRTDVLENKAATVDQFGTSYA